MTSFHQRPFSAADVESVFSHGGWNAGTSRRGRKFKKTVLVELDIRQDNEHRRDTAVVSPL